MGVVRGVTCQMTVVASSTGTGVSCDKHSCMCIQKVIVAYFQ